jgi:hypothetical protein
LNIQSFHTNPKNNSYKQDPAVPSGSPGPSIDRASDAIQKALSSGSPNSPAPVGQKGGDSTASSKEEEAMLATLSGAIVVEKPRVSWTEVLPGRFA